MNRLFCIIIVVLIFSCISCTPKKNEKINNVETIHTKENLNKKLIECVDKYDFTKAVYWLSMGADPNVLYKNQSLLSYSTCNGSSPDRLRYARYIICTGGYGPRR